MKGSAAMREFNTAPNYDNYEPENQLGTSQRSRANVPLTYRVAGEDAQALPVIMPPEPLPPPPGQTTRQPAVPGGYRTQPTAGRAVAPVPTLRPLVQPEARPRLEISGLFETKLKLVVLGLGLLIVSLLAYLLISLGLQAWQSWQDDVAYGRPRTMQLDQFVGHNEQDGTPSHFIAQNNNRQVTVVEYPGGDVSKTKVFQGPRLFGKDSELMPVKIRFEDANGDNHVDMLLSVGNELVIYINQDGNFRPISGEERARFLSNLRGKAEK